MSSEPVALLVIDMQVGSFVDTPASHDLGGVVGRINSLGDAVRAASAGRGGVEWLVEVERGLRGTTGSPTLSRLRPVPDW